MLLFIKIYFITSILITILFASIEKETNTKNESIYYVALFFFWLPLLILLMLTVIALYIGGKLWKSTQAHKKL